MNSKLYALNVVENESSFARVIACSNQIEKLTAVVFTPTHSITVVSNPNNKMLKMKTDDDVYPQYLIYEIPYIV